jgi:hypothetical protein
MTMTRLDFRPRPSRALTLCLVGVPLVAALSACTDAPVAAVTPDADPDGHRLLSTARSSESPYGCYVSEAVRNPHYRYRYSRRELHFPLTAGAEDGSTLEYRLRLQRPGEEPVYVANCVIPRTLSAVRLLEQWLRVPKDVRYTVTNGAGRARTATATTLEEPCSSKVGDAYDPNRTCFTLGGIVAVTEPPSSSPPPPPAPTPPPGESPVGGGGGTGGGDQPCYDCTYGGSGTLGCTASVQRGGTVSCSIMAAREAESNLVVHSWTFVDADGNSTQSPDPVVAWSGTAVVGGTVTVRFDDGSGEREVVSSFTVTDRGWTWARSAESVFSDGTGVQCSHWSTPDQGGSNGINLPLGASSCAVAARSIQPDSYDPAGDGFVAKTVQSGPNQGFHYIESARLNLKRESSYNVRLRPDAPLVPLLQLGYGQRPCGQMVNWYQFTICQGVDPEAYIQGAHFHEGYGVTGHNGHYSAAYDAVADPANDPMIYFDQRVGSNSMGWDAFVDDVRIQFHQRADAADRATLDLSQGGTIVTGNYSGIYYGYYAPQGQFFSHFRRD